jgi:hypothetical protein
VVVWSNRKPVSASVATPVAPDVGNLLTTDGVDIG